MSRPTKSIANAYYKMAISDLVAARNALGWSQYELARRWNRHQSIVAKIETCERRVDLIEFIDLCVLLEIDPYETISGIHEQIRVGRDRRDGDGKDVFTP
ncbi:MAG TPA: helix-turn-helix transcriptional regulator [Asticcacaulis sp.]|nr:helix-turn-helix transcriptional regulator [Asticcacaulis sp.]